MRLCRGVFSSTLFRIAKLLFLCPKFDGVLQCLQILAKVFSAFVSRTLVFLSSGMAIQMFSKISLPFERPCCTYMRPEFSAFLGQSRSTSAVQKQVYGEGTLRSHGLKHGRDIFQTFYQCTVAGVSSSETRILIKLFDKFSVIKRISLIKKIFWGSL